MEVQHFSDAGGGSGSSNGNPVGTPGQPPPPPQQPPSPAPFPPPPAQGYPAPPPAPPQYAPPPQYGPPPQTPYPAPPQTPYPPPAYPQPPQQPGYGAPATYAPPPAAYPQPVPQQPGFAPPPARPGGGSRTLVIVGVVAVLLILVLAGGGILANASFSSTYSPGKAVQNYFAAQARGDVDFMVANANYLKGSNGSDALFGKDAVTAMVSGKENKSVSNVTVDSTDQLDASTSKVTVSMSWNGSQVTESYTVHKDTTRTHFLFYSDWRIDIPASTISVTLPNQAGALQVDGIAVESSATTIDVIQGYHSVTMQQTDLYDADNETVNAVDATAAVTFASKLGSAAQSAAVDAVKRAFANNSWCDAGKYFDCPAHKYTVPAGYYDTLPAAGGDIRANSNWLFTYTGDPTSGMTLSVATTAGDVTVKGTCAMQLVVDGSATYNFTGDFSGTLNWQNGGFGYDITENCDANRA